MVLPRPLFPDVTEYNPRPMGNLLAYQASRDPDAPCLTFEGVTISRIEMERNANRRARAFEKLGVRKDDFVIVALPNGPEFHETCFALWKLGATPTPASYRLPDHELAGIAEVSHPALVVGIQPERLSKWHCIPAGFLPDPELSDGPLPDCVAKHWKAATSGGSTGRPKVIVDHGESAFDPDVTLLAMEVDDVMLMPAPLYHNGPFSQTALGMIWGAHVVEMARFDAREWLQLVERHKIKWAYVVPTMMHRIWNLPDEVKNAYDISSLEVLMHMAAPCPAWLKMKWIEWIGPEKVWEIYAGTESIGGTSNNGVDWLERPGTVGSPLPGNQISIRDEAGEPLPAGEIGEVYFIPANGRGSTYHYLGADAKSSGEWESYGDMGYLDEDGFLYLADRRTDMILSGGANIYPAEIEAVIDRYPGVISSVAVGLPDPDLGKRVHAVIQSDEPLSAFAPDQFEPFLSEYLARYKLPYTYEVTTEPLRDDTGKVRRSKILETRLARQEAGENFTLLRGSR